MQIVNYCYDYLKKNQPVVCGGCFLMLKTMTFKEFVKQLKFFL